MPTQLLQKHIDDSWYKPTLVQTTSRWSPLLDGAECAEESTDAAILQEQQSQCPKLIVLRIVQYE
jgi:hypothetical protein